MKTLFIALFIANITLIAYGKFDLHTNPADIKSEIDPSQIILMSPEELISRIKPPPVHVAIPTICLEWGSFPDSDSVRVEQALVPLQLGEKMKKRQHEINTGYWVYIPPLKTKAEAEKKGKELEKFGVTEYFLIQDNGDSHNAISLGVFKTEEAASNYLAQLKEKGVRSARVGVRNQSQTVFIFEDIAQTLMPRFTELQKEFPASEVKSIDCKLPQKSPA